MAQMEQFLNRWIKIIFILVLVAAGIYFLALIADLVKLLIVAALLAYILDPLVTLIESNGISRAQATVIFYLASALVFGLISLLLLPYIGDQIAAMTEGFDYQKTQEMINKINVYFNEHFTFLGGKELNLTGELADKLVEFGNAFMANLFSMFTLILYLVILPFIVFFFLKDGRSVKKVLISLVPNRYFELACTLLYKMDVQLGNYLRGQVMDASIIGLLTTIAMWILGEKHFLIIGVFSGFANLIPYMGPLCGLALAVLLSILDTGDFTLVLYIVLAFGIIRIIDDILVQPAVVAKNVDLPPLVVLLAVLIGGKFFSVLGMLLSVPVTAIIKVTYQEGMKIYRRYRFS
jgi:predicted PurR-regulated permease PerM